MCVELQHLRAARALISFLHVLALPSLWSGSAQHLLSPDWQPIHKVPMREATFLEHGPNLCFQDGRGITTAQEFRPTEQWWKMCMWLCFSYCLGWWHIPSELIGDWEQRLSCWVMVWDEYWICAMSVIEAVLSAARLGIQSYSSMVSPAVMLKQSVSNHAQCGLASLDLYRQCDRALSWHPQWKSFHAQQPACAVVSEICFGSRSNII